MRRRSNMSITDDRTLVNANEASIQNFVMNYLGDVGVGVQLIEAVTKELFGQHVASGDTVDTESAKTATELIRASMQDVINVGLFGDVSFDLEKVIAGAVSLEFLVRYARKLNAAVLPPSVIPSDELVAAALALFHDAKKPVDAVIES
jgi:hypothetical protein